MASKKTKRNPAAVRSQMHRRGRVQHEGQERNTLGWTGTIFLLHGLCLALLFDQLPGIVNSQPVIEQDWGLHFHHLKSIEAFWHQDKRLWGYNPLFAAGYPSNTIQDLSIKLFEVGALLLSYLGLAPIQGFKLLAFLAAASVPWLMYFSARNLMAGLELRDRVAFIATLAGTLYWWNSLPREMFFYGMLGFPVACYLAIVGVSLLHRIAHESSFWTPAHFGFILFAIVALPLHVQAVVVFIPPTLAFLIARMDLLRRNLLLWCLMAAALTTVVNLVWLVPALSHRTDDASAAIVEQLPLFVSDDPLTFLKDFLAPTAYWSFRPSVWEKGFRLMLLTLGVMGTVDLFRSQRKELGVMLATALVTLFVIAYFGSMVPAIKAWQPLRFKVAFDLFLILGASYLTAAWMIARSRASRSYLVPLGLTVGILALLINVAHTESQGKMRLRSGISPEASGIVDWVNKDTSSNARVLFEESGDETGFVYDGVYLSSLLAHWTGRQLIGGPINLYNDRHHFAEFHSGKLFKKDIQTISDDELRNYLRIYNIGAVVVFHPASINRFLSLPGLVRLDQRAGPAHLMIVHQPLTWLVEGEGQVKAGFDRIEVSNAKGDAVVLKYHWTNGLSSIPQAKVEPVIIGDDPIPFIKVNNPPSSFVLKTKL